MLNETCSSCGRNLLGVECCCPNCGAMVNGSITSLEPVTLTPEFLELARQEFTEEEIVAGIEEIERTGGLKLEDFIHELEAIVTPRE